MNELINKCIFHIHMPKCILQKKKKINQKNIIKLVLAQFYTEALINVAKLFFPRSKILG